MLLPLFFKFIREYFVFLTLGNYSEISLKKARVESDVALFNVT